MGKVKGLEKGSVDMKPVPIVEQPVFDARSPMFAVACCLRCSKLVGSEGLFCVRPSKHSKCYRCANNGVHCEPIPAPYKAEFSESQDDRYKPLGHILSKMSVPMIHFSVQAF